MCKILKSTLIIFIYSRKGASFSAFFVVSQSSPFTILEEKISVLPPLDMHIYRLRITEKGKILLNKAVSIIGLLIIIGFVAYSESPNSFLSHENEHDNLYQMIPVVNDVKEAEEVDQPVADEDPLDGIIPSLELKLVDTQVEDNEIIETYRQYEVYRDNNNKVIEMIALDEYEYLKYEK